MQLSFGFFHHEQPSSPLGSIIQRKHSLTFPKCPTVAEQRQQGHHDCQYFDIQNLYLHRVVPFTSTYAIIMWALLSQRESQLAYGMELSLFLPQGLRSSYSKRIQGRPSSCPASPLFRAWGGHIALSNRRTSAAYFIYKIIGGVTLWAWATNICKLARDEGVVTREPNSQFCLRLWSDLPFRSYQKALLISGWYWTS